MLVSEYSEQLRQHLKNFYNMIEYEKTANPEVNAYELADKYVKSEIDCENGMKAYYDAVDEVHRRNQRLLRAIKSVKGKTFCKHLAAFIEDREATDWEQWEIVSEPKGEEQTVSEYGREIKREWVQQWSQGTEGDSWAGIIHIQIKPNKYLKFYFSM